MINIRESVLTLVSWLAICALMHYPVSQYWRNTASSEPNGYTLGLTLINPPWYTAVGISLVYF